MKETRTRSRLRTYLILWFVPLTVLPLVALAYLSQFFLARALDHEINLRSRSELAAVSRSLDTAERRLSKELLDLSRRPEVQEGTLRHAMKAAWLGPALKSTHFDEIKMYQMDNGRRAAHEERREAKRREVESLFGSNRRRRAPSSEVEERGPATSSGKGAAKAAFPPTHFLSAKARFASGEEERLSEDFRLFLRQEDAWSLREVVALGGDLNDARPSLQWVFYKTILDRAFRPLAVLEAKLTLNNQDLAALADVHDVELALLSPVYGLIGGSRPEILTKLGLYAPELRKNLSLGNDKSLSRTIELSRETVAFSFAPLTNEAGDTLVWMAAGLNKDGQVRLRREIFFWVAGLATALAAVVALITVRVSRRITEPITELVDAVEAMKLGEWVHPIEADTTTEIGLLVRRFNEMAQSVQITKRMLETKLEELATAHGALTETQGQLVQSAKLSSLGQLVAGVAHELNNPIAFIYSNMAQMKAYLKNLAALDELLKSLEKKLPASESEQLRVQLKKLDWQLLRQDMDEMVQSCLEGSIRVKDIVLGLRNFSRLDRGEVEEADLNQALENTAKLLNSQLRNRVSVHWDLGQGAKVRCNLAQINQVFMNLMANAAQAIPGSGNLWIRSWVEAAADGQSFVCISIRDDGKGIPQENIDRIFDPFFTTKKVGEGMGLGLSIVYGIIERHRGIIQVQSQSQPGQKTGTEFLIKLPQGVGSSAVA